MHQMSGTELKKNVYIVSVPGENDVGTKRFWLLRAAAEKAAEAFKQGFYLEAITLTESLLGTRLESRLTWVRSCQNNSHAVTFSTLGFLCKELLHDDAKVAPDWNAFQAPIQEISKWVQLRNEALHGMAKLEKEDGRDFCGKYEACRTTALNGFGSLLSYDATDREERGKAQKLTATDDLRGGTAFDCLRDIIGDTSQSAVV
jgi:hypothetical protein